MISISILDADLMNIEKVLCELHQYGITHVHLDVLDTSFVSNISFGPCIINKILEHDFIFDIHLMVATPLQIIDKLCLQYADTVTVHYEINDLEKVVAHLHSKNVKVGIAINPCTVIHKEIPQVHRILIMTVQPGYGKQQFIETSLDKIKFIDDKYEIGIDGGLNIHTIEKVKMYNYHVIGSAFFRATDKKKFLEEVNEKLK